MEKMIQRRSIVLLLPTDSETADEITAATVSFLKTNYKLKQHQIETNKRTIFIKNYMEVDEK
jgi:LytS/YehU family sensor histidine kinase